LVATGCAPIGIGTDTGGSVRIPSAFCGLVGWKPAVGRLSTLGVVPLAPTFDHVGVLTRRVDDAVLVDQVLDGGLARRAPGGRGEGAGLRAALLEDPSLPPVTAVVADALTRVCGRAGITAVVRSGSGPADLPPAAAVVEAFGVLQRAEALAVHRDLLGTWPDQADAYGDDVAGRMREAELLDPAAVVDARLAWREVSAAYNRAFTAAEIDAVVLPAAAGGPSTIIDPDTVDVDGRPMPLREAVMPFTIPANMTGWPALVVPAERDVVGVPASVQIVVRPGCERLLADFAARLRG
jgi:aspartyl-tRNA(Asn)/glutamyl-tRNA(Gln) amidotransferase subunit A